MNEPKKTPIENGHSYAIASAQVSISNLDGYNHHLLGRILTLIDSSMQDGTQKDALKDLIKQDFWSARDKVWSWMSKDKTDDEKQPFFPFIKK